MPGFGSAIRSGVAGGAANAKHGDVVPRIEREHVGAVRAAVAGNLHRRVVLSGDDVCGGDDEPRCREPAAALDAEAAGTADDPDDGRLGADDRGAARDRRARRHRGRRRPDDRRERVDAGEQPEQAVRRDLLVEAADDFRALDFVTEAGLAGDEQRGRTHHPDECDAGGRPEHGAADRIEEAKRREPEPAAHEGAEDARDRLKNERADERAGEPGERRPGRGRAAVEHVRRRPRAEIGAGDEAHEGEGARNEAAAEAAEGGQPR